MEEYFILTSIYYPKKVVMPPENPGKPPWRNDWGIIVEKVIIFIWLEQRCKVSHHIYNVEGKDIAPFSRVICLLIIFFCSISQLFPTFIPWIYYILVYKLFNSKFAIYVKLPIWVFISSGVQVKKYKWENFDWGIQIRQKGNTSAKNLIIARYKVKIVREKAEK